MIFENVIIGQGIAGSCLALHLLERGEDFLVIDNHLHRSSSLVAAGLYNPVVFRKPSLSFQAHQLIPYLQHFYSHWEEKLDSQFHYSREIWKLFTSVEEINNWDIKAGQEEFYPFADQQREASNFDPNIHCEFGAGKALQAGNVDLPNFLKLVGEYLGEKLLQSEMLGYRKTESSYELDLGDRTIHCKRLFLCTGHQNLPDFKYLPLGDTKGDVLTISCPELNRDRVLNKGFFILPLEEGQHRVGATFEWDDKSYEPSSKAREELQGKIETVLKKPYEVVDQKSGLRPTVGDRRPLLGEHPDHENLYIFNGLGSKGVMLAPFYANHLLEHIFDGNPLDSEVDIQRYLKHYGHSEN